MLLLVGPNIVQEENEGNESSSSLGSQNGDLSRGIAWSISSLESLRPNNVANAEAAGNEGHADDSLRLPSNIRGSPLVNDDKSGCNGIDEVNASQLGTLILDCEG